MIALLIVLLVGNAVFVMAEMALVSAKRGRLQTRADRGDRGAKAALTLLDNPNRLFSTVQIGITLIAILLGAFGEAAIADRVSAWLVEQPFIKERQLERVAQISSLVGTVVLLTYVSLILTELVPKRLARAHAEAIASRLTPTMALIARLAAPLIWLLALSTDLVLRLVPVRASSDADSAEEEVKALLQSGTESGAFHQSEQELVERVFKMADLRIAALMVPRVDIDFLFASDTSDRVRVVLATTSHSHYPVCNSSLDDLIGTVHVKDLVKAGILADELDLKALAEPPVFVPESTPAIRVLDRFRTTGNHIAFVIDEYGAVVGLVTLSDLLAAIVGEIARTPEPVDPPIVRRADGSYLVDGMLPVAELKELLSVATLPREDEAGFETLGGFLMSALRRIPATGDRFTHERFTFEVVDMDRTRVDKVLLTMHTPDPEANSPGEGV
jgi:putative hemolysin